MKTRRILVTGGAGFIGSHIAEELAKGNEVIILDDFSTGKRENIFELIKKENVQLVEGSITDLILLEKLFEGVDYVFHLAALVSVEESMKNPKKYFEINVLGFLNILNSAIKCDVKKVMFSSSSAVYEGGNLPRTETMLPQPSSPYALTKLDGEYLLNIFFEEYGVKFVALRYFNVFGPRQDSDSSYSAVIPIFIKRAMGNEDLIIYGDGSQTRDFIYVSDVIKANISAMSRGHGVINLGTNRSISITDLATTIIKITKSKSRIRYAKERPGDVKHSLADITKSKIELDWKPKINLEEGLRETIKWFGLMEINK